jgi:hypothetical protein
MTWRRSKYKADDDRSTAAPISSTPRSTAATPSRSTRKTTTATTPLPRYDPAIPALMADEYFEDDEWKILDEADPPF